MKFICYNYLPVLADYVIDLPLQSYLNCGITPLHTYKYPVLANLREGDKIFVKTDLLRHFFTTIFPYIQKPIYLITGVSDYEIHDKYLPYLNDKRILKWIGVNISIQQHPKIKKMLIGFQEPDRRRNGPATGEGGDQEILAKAYTHARETKFNEKYNKIFVPALSRTHSSRDNILTTFKNLLYVELLHEKLDFKVYLYKLHAYKFVLCPRGNGIDTHRFCEILLMGSVPIVERNGLTDLYEKFPCIIVENFTDILALPNTIPTDLPDLFKNYIFDLEKYKVFENYLFTEKIDINAM
jgi:hypothetical protein